VTRGAIRRREQHISLNLTSWRKKNESEIDV
jgi:hypothetical protein